MCICDMDRFSNCFTFTHRIEQQYSRGINPCQHDGQCLCVAIERTFSVFNGAIFNKRKSVTTAKGIVVLILVLTTLTHLHDPLRRHWIDDIDGDQRRIWCFLKYSSSLTIYNSFITLFHFLVLFAINLLSALLLITIAARIRSKVDKKQDLKQHIRLQFHQHRHILTAPCLLILLSLPRLIISFASGCMRSARQPWLHLFGYFISFISTMSIFFVFVLPSKIYKTEFDTFARKIIRGFRSTA